jgi:hypothetical protein
VNIVNKARKFVVSIVSFTMLVALTACGEGEEQAPAATGGQSIGDVVACLLFYVWINGSCEPNPDNPPPVEPPPDTEPEPNPDTWSLTYIVDLEPNDTLDTAQPATIATRTPQDEYVGFIVRGTVNGQSDVTDAFIFTASVSRDYRFNLCQENGCAQSGDIDVNKAFYRVLDQDGTVLLTTQGDELSRNATHMHIDAGVVYYITVMAGDTMGLDLEYRLSIAEIAN